MDTLLPWIAVVDDEEAVRRALLRLLGAAGLPARGFAGGAELLAADLPQPPYCVVLDFHMPGMDGAELQQRLASAMPGSAIIAITGAHSPATQARMLQGGALAYLPKPVDEQQLLAAIANAWARWHHPLP